MLPLPGKCSLANKYVMIGYKAAVIKMIMMARRDMREHENETKLHLLARKAQRPAL